MNYINNLGEFDSLADVWKEYPHGGKEGDYVVINGVNVAWNKYTTNWGADTEMPDVNNEVNGDFLVKRDLRVGGEIINKGLKWLKDATIITKGYFATLNDLKKNYPSAQAGAKAYVGTNVPYKIYIWNAKDNAWLDTGEYLDDSNRNKGYYKDVQRLKESHPVATEGSKAYVGENFPYAIYLWDTTTSTWQDSGVTGGEEYVSLNDYSTKAETEELALKSLINAQIFSGFGWGESQEYRMFPAYEYEITNVGNNPIIAINAGYTGSGAVDVFGFPEGGLQPNSSAILTVASETTDVRFYFNGESSLVMRAVIKVDEKLEDLENNVNDLDEKIDKNTEALETPFLNALKIPTTGNNAPFAIKNIRVIVGKGAYMPTLGVSYIWKEVNGNWFIRIVEHTASGWERWCDWSRDDYKPSNPSCDIIKISKGNVVVHILVDWEVMLLGDSWSAFTLELRPQCYEVADSQVINDVGGSMSLFADAFIDAKHFVSSYKDLDEQKFALAYFWKNYGDNATCLIRIIQLLPTVKDNYASLSFSNVADEIAEYTIDNKFYFKIDWSKVPNGLAWSGVGEIDNYFIPENNEVIEGYSSKDCTKRQVIVSQDGSGDFTSIGEAYSSITDSSYNNQYEIVVYSGIYDEYNLIPPPFSHTYGLYPNSVTVTSRKWANKGDTLPVFDQMRHSSKLSNMTIESWTGYCVHFDVDLNNASLKNENLHLIKQYYEGALMSIVGGGSYKKGARYEWKGCVFECVGADGNAACHTNTNATGDNTSLIFDACTFIKCVPAIGSVGAFGKSTCEIRNCQFGYGYAGLMSWFSPLRNIDNPTQYLSNRMEWSVIGGGNKNFANTARNVINTIRLKADYPITISGNAVECLFGNNYQTQNKTSNRVKATLTSMYYIADNKAGSSAYTEERDVFQMWKRLGDCSEENKVLNVTVNGVTNTHTFNKNYTSLKMAESDILSEMSASLANCVVEKYADNSIGYDFINTTDKIFIEVNEDDILKGEFVTKTGKKATRNTPVHQIAGVAVGDAVRGDAVPVWTSAISLADTVYSGEGDIGLNDDGELYWTGADKPIGFVKKRILYPYY